MAEKKNDKELPLEQIGEDEELEYEKKKKERTAEIKTNYLNKMLSGDEV